MTYLSIDEAKKLRHLLMVFFALPYSTDLDGKDVEKLIRRVKGIEGPISRRKELFDIVSGTVGYSVKTLFKRPLAQMVDLQEQRFCDKADLDVVRQAKYAVPDHSAQAQGEVLLSYMRRRAKEQMDARGITLAKSAILLKYWNPPRTTFQMRYWEEDFLGYIDDLWDRNARGEIYWVEKDAGLHGQDHRTRVRLIRMHYKHNQIFTDHHIPRDAQVIDFRARVRDWEELYGFLYGNGDDFEDTQALF